MGRLWVVCGLELVKPGGGKEATTAQRTRVGPRSVSSLQPDGVTPERGEGITTLYTRGNIHLARPISISHPGTSRNLDSFRPYHSILVWQSLE